VHAIIGSTSPGQKLAVSGVIESTSGGFKFPDGTTQTTAATGSASQWTTSGTTINYSSGNVGIGSATPAKLLDVAGLYQVDGTTGTATHNFPDMSGGALIAKYAGTQVFNATYATMTIGPWQSGFGYTIQTNSNAASLNLNVTTAAPLVFSTSNTERMRILSGGNVGIGTTAPTAPLDVELNANAPGLQIGNALATSYSVARFLGTGRDFRIGVGNASETTLGVANKFFIFDWHASAMRMTIDSAGNVGIGTTSPSYTLHVNGSVAGNGAYIALSDIRFKKDVQDLVGSLAKVLAIRGVSYKWIDEEKNGSGTQYGVTSSRPCRPRGMI
jgi:trimeric autotransporter adhesin